MKLAFIFHLKDSFGGAERRLTRIYNELCLDHSDVHCDIVIRGCNKKTALKLFELADCQINNIDNIVAFEKSYTCLAYLLFSRKYDAVHFFSASDFNLAVERVCKASRKKTIYTVCGYREACNIAISEKGTLLVKKQLTNADVVDLLNPSGLNYVSKFIKGKTYITPGTFTDLDVFRPIPKEKTIVYAAARLDETKNPMLLVEAVNEVQKTIRENGFKVFLLGKGVLEDELRIRIGEFGISDIISMEGYQKSSNYIPQASVLLSLQSMENYPSQTVAEAAASGCYLIITDVGDSRKLADESFSTFVKNDCHELADAIVQYIKMSDSEKREVINNSRRFAEKHFSIKESIEYFYDIIINIKERVSRDGN